MKVSKEETQKEERSVEAVGVTSYKFVESAFPKFEVKLVKKSAESTIYPNSQV